MSPSTDRRIGSDAHVAVWAAIQQYVVACGGDPNQVTDGRMDAAAAIERAVDRRAAELAGAAAVGGRLLDLLPQVTPQRAATWTRQDGMACRVEVEGERLCVYGRDFRRGCMRWHIDELMVTDLGCPAQLEAAIQTPPAALDNHERMRSESSEKEIWDEAVREASRAGGGS
ncbi:hypothetical protein [Hyphomicrobium sp.]|uniref:hypothetical protein n=1 Tax=Hyphomicrobium sp. TaxID=82 RepID=UPI0025BF45EF|nr:hypothetical protein [Hyphomicrobium sp.]MCC7251204.1 hypothetical protein [Hyphomicrobium sp.]